MDDEKKKEMQYVRAEKAADEAITDKLVQMYGKGPQKEVSFKRSRQGWKCKECNFINYDCRFACASCLSVPEGVAANAKPNSALPLGNNRTLQEPAVKIVTRMGRSYRMFANVTAPTRAPAETAPEADIPHYEEDDLVLEEDGEDDPSCNVTRDATTGNVVLTWALPPQYNKFIIGSRGQTLADIERTTGATVLIQSHDGANRIVIRAPAVQCIRAAKLRIEIIIEEFKDRVAYTHFVSIPLGTIPSLRDPIHALFDTMKASLCSLERRIDETIFQRPARVHLTLLMLRLYSEEDKSKCLTVMRDVQRWISETFTCHDGIHLQRLNYMNDDPSRVDVVYLEVAPNPARDKLLALIERINQAFMASGLSQPKDIEHNERIHATILNSKWRQSKEKEKRVPFDITDVMANFGDIDLGTHPLERIDVSVLCPVETEGGLVTEDQYYTAIHSVAFPKS